MTETTQESEGKPVPFPEIFAEDFPLEFDLDGDGAANFYVKYGGVTNGVTISWQTSFVTRKEGAILTSRRTQSHFEQGFLIGQNPSYLDSTRAPLTWSSLGADICWKGETEKRWTCSWPMNRTAYLGLRTKTEAGFRYGWVALELKPKEQRMQVLISDYAVSPVPGKPIRAGEHP